MESFEDKGQVLGRYAGSVVGDLDQHRAVSRFVRAAPVDWRRSNRQRWRSRPGVAELQGVVHQVGHGPFHLGRGSPRGDRVGFDQHLAPGATSCAPRHPFGQSGQVELRRDGGVVTVGCQLDDFVGQLRQLGDLGVKVGQQRSALGLGQLGVPGQHLQVEPKAGQGSS